MIESNLWQAADYATSSISPSSRNELLQKSLHMLTVPPELLNSLWQLSSSPGCNQLLDLARLSAQHREVTARDILSLIDDTVLDKVCQSYVQLAGCNLSVPDAPAESQQRGQAAAFASLVSSISDTISASSDNKNPAERLQQPWGACETPHLSSNEASEGRAVQGDGSQCGGKSPSGQHVGGVEQSMHVQCQPHHWQRQQEPRSTCRKQTRSVLCKDTTEVSEAELATEARPEQPSKRGRPPKTPGVFSKGYMAIRRYRQRKKGMVEQMEQEIEAKHGELVHLQEENIQLRLQQNVLAAAVAAQDAVLAELPQLRQFMDIMPSSSSVSDNSIVPAQAIASLDRAFGSDGSRSGTCAAAAECTATLLQVAAELEQTRQYVQSNRVQMSGVALDCYKAYVADSALQLAQDVSAALPGAPAALAAAAAATSVSSGLPAKSFAAFPLGPVQASLLWDPARTASAAQLPIPAEVKHLPASLSLLSLNLETGQFDPVDEGFWKQVAEQLVVVPVQQQQLDVAWTLCAAAHERLDQQRHQLLQQLRLHGEGCLLPGSVAATAAAFSEGAEKWLQLACAVEQYLLTARVVVIAHNWCLKGILGDEQFAKLCIACWPYYGVPHIRLVVGYLLGKR